MAGSDPLYEIVQNLIDRRTEGTYWDFKRQHHENSAELIHDVLCLANADHAGDRYLIFGVENQTFTLHSIDGTLNRRTQADVITLLQSNSSKFYESRTPEVHLRELNIDGAVIDVLVIEDKPHKPYHLTQDYRNKGTVVKSNHNYTRVGDTNIPIIESAPPHELQRMWRQRFGLDQSPLERVKLLLAEPDAWTQMSEQPIGGNASYYHNTFPEFTMRVADNDLVDYDEEWTRGEISTDKNVAWFFELYYHQTLLHRTLYVSFDDRKKRMAAPNWEPRERGGFYFYEADGVDYAVQQFFASIYGEDNSKSLRIRGRGQIQDKARALWPNRRMEIPVLRAGQLEDFLQDEGDSWTEKPSTDRNEQYEIFLRNQIDFKEWHEG